MIQRAWGRFQCRLNRHFEQRRFPSIAKPLKPYLDTNNYKVIVNTMDCVLVKLLGSSTFQIIKALVWGTKKMPVIGSAVRPVPVQNKAIKTGLMKLNLFLRILIKDL